MLMMEPGDETEVLISDISSAGWGVGRGEPDEQGSRGPVVFVPRAAPGEKVSVKVTEVRKNRVLGELVEVLEASPHRIEPPCPYFGTCPGCSLQYLSYEGQLAAKAARLSGILGRAIGDEDYSPEVVPSPEPFAYRTHLTLACENDGSAFSVGFKDPATKRAVDIPKCLLIPGWANAEYTKLREQLFAASDELPAGFRLRLFLDYETSQTYIVAPRGPLKRHRRTPYVLRDILDGFPRPRTLTREILGVRIRLHPASFVQANQYMMDQLYGAGLGAAQAAQSDLACDLYAGSGFFTLALAGRVREAVAIEADRRACDNLEKSARELAEAEKKARRKEPTIHIAQGRAEDLIEDVLEKLAPTLIVANPPRSGLHVKVRSALSGNESVRRIVMISCDPSTCARDLKELMEAGFRTEPAVLLDCYPQTAHMEIVLGLERT